MQSEWESRAFELSTDQPRLGSYPAAGLIRRARRIADYSQREMAVRAGVSPSTVGRAESGAIQPSLDVMQRLLATAGLYLAVVDGEGRVVLPMLESEDTRDGADRRYPSHLDTILDPRPGEWWADAFGLARPPETFFRDRQRRDEMRARSRWQVRAKQLRGAPEPPVPGAEQARAALQRRIRAERARGVMPPEVVNPYDLDWDQ